MGREEGEANLLKHGFDFADAALVYYHPNKVTFDSVRKSERRLKDVVYVQSQ